MLKNDACEAMFAYDGPYMHSRLFEQIFPLFFYFKICEPSTLREAHKLSIGSLRRANIAGGL